MRHAKKLNVSCHFGGAFEALSKDKIDLMIARWKALDVYYPTQVEFLDLDVISPTKIAISQDWFLLVQKVAERPFSRCFWPFRQPKT